MSSITRVLHSTTWDYFTSRLPGRFSRSQKVVKEAIMTDVYNLVLEFWRTSGDGVTGACFFAMRRLFEILRACFWGVRFDIISMFATAVDLADKTYSCRQTPISGAIPPNRLTTEPEPNLRYCLTGIERCSISQFLNPKIWQTCSSSYLVS